MERETETSTKTIEDGKLELERKRLAIETRLKRRDQQFQHRQFDAGRKGVAAYAQFLTPVGAAVIAGMLGLFGTVWNGYQSNLIETNKQIANEKLERQKLESTLVLDAIKTAGAGEEKERQTAANLLFLANAGFLTLPPDKLGIIKEKAGDLLPSLPNTRSPLAPTEDVPVPAKHYKEREGESIKSIIIHATESAPSLESLVQFFHTTEDPTSSHYLIGKDGQVAKILDESYASFHAGRTSDPKFNNSSSIGIDLVGFSKDGFTEQQVAALENLLVEIVKRRNIDVNDIVGHKDVAVPRGRKIDPGPKLDLNKVREAVRTRLSGG